MALSPERTPPPDTGATEQGDGSEKPPYRQLRMLWPAGRRPDPAHLKTPPGYRLRLAAGADDAQLFRQLMTRVELGRWDDEMLARTTSTVVPDGWNVIVHGSDPGLVATGMGHHRPVPDLYPDGYEVGWIAASPDHSGHGLGRLITAVATARLIEVGAECIYLQTDDFRLPAVRSYLSVGFVPHLWTDGMHDRWQTICSLLKAPFTPDAWPAFQVAE